MSDLIGPIVCGVLMVAAVVMWALVVVALNERDRERPAKRNGEQR